jgi:hypothetical protein
MRLDPIIRGLLTRLPKPGEVWPTDERAAWLNLLEGALKVIYKDGTTPGVAGASPVNPPRPVPTPVSR